MQAKAEARYIRVSPQKARLVVDLIRGQKAGAALITLRTTNKRIAPTVEKVLKSAISNATNKSKDVDVDQLVVQGRLVDSRHVPRDEIRGPRRDCDRRMHRTTAGHCDRQRERREVAEQEVLRHVRRERTVLAPRCERREDRGEEKRDADAK